MRLTHCPEIPGLKGHEMIFSPFPKSLICPFLKGLTGIMAQLSCVNMLIRSILILLIMLSPTAVYAASVPQPLSTSDVAHYKRLLELQKSGNMKQAIREMGRVKDPMLKGYVLAQRYLHPTAWRSSYKELSSWLTAYNDHPDASRIYWLAKRRQPVKARARKHQSRATLMAMGRLVRTDIAHGSRKQRRPCVANSYCVRCAQHSPRYSSWLAIGCVGYCE